MFRYYKFKNKQCSYNKEIHGDTHNGCSYPFGLSGSHDEKISNAMTRMVWTVDKVVDMFIDYIKKNTD